MNTFTLKLRTILSSAVAAAVCLVGCGGGDDNPSGGGGGGGGVSGGSLNYGGQTYRTVIIGGKRWMAENLNVTTDASFCYDNNSSYCNTYGRLYTWSAALTACPPGWRLSTRDDWNQLGEAVGGEEHTYFSNYDGVSLTEWVYADKALKSTSGWGSGGNGNNTFGFTALPGGVGYGSTFLYVGSYGMWWEAEDFSDSKAYIRYITTTYEYVGEMPYEKGLAASVRCVSD